MDSKMSLSFPSDVVDSMAQAVKTCNGFWVCKSFEADGTDDSGSANVIYRQDNPTPQRAIPFKILELQSI